MTTIRFKPDSHLRDRFMAPEAFQHPASPLERQEMTG